MEGEKVAAKSVLVALAIGLAIWATMGSPVSRSSNSVVHLTAC